MRELIVAYPRSFTDFQQHDCRTRSVLVVRDVSHQAFD